MKISSYKEVYLLIAAYIHFFCDNGHIRPKTELIPLRVPKPVFENPYFCTKFSCIPRVSVLK